jgi:type II secretory pathway predicted ATPase ExeA
MENGVLIVSDKTFSHLHPAAALVVEREAEYRIRWLGKIQWIEHPEATKIHSKIIEIIDQEPSDRMENILLFGDSGVGKTVLLNKVLEPYNGSSTASGYISPRPAIMVNMPHKPTTKDFLESILDVFNTPTTKLGALREVNLLPLVTKLLRISSTRVLIIDEINSIRVGNLRQQRELLQLLRFLSNELHMALVCAGMPEARYALDSDPQLRSRSHDVELPIWKAGPDLQKFINLLVQSKPLRMPSPVESTQLCKLVADRSNGITSSICKAINRAAVGAIRSGREMIDLAALQDPDVWGGAWTGRTDVILGNPPYRRAGTAPK